MSGETEDDVSGWTVDTLHALLVTRFQLMHELLNERKAAQDKAIDAGLAAQEKAIIKADAATEKRFDSVNEFRQTLSDQASNFVTRAEFEATKTTSLERLDDIKARIDKQEGKGVGLNASWIYLLGAIAAMGTIVSIFVLFL